MTYFEDWIIEIRKDDAARYFQFSDGDQWTHDRDSALHFARKQDAERMIAYYKWTDAMAINIELPA